jgi:hypothetical protein
MNKKYSHVKSIQSTSPNELIVGRSTRKHPKKVIGIETLLSYINGYDQSKADYLKLKSATIAVKQYIYSNNLSELSWSKILLHQAKEGSSPKNPFPFSDNEYLDIVQVSNEKQALKRLLQFFHQPKPKQ